MREFRIVVMGAGGVGKSALTVQFVQGVYVESYDPTIEDSYRKVITIEEQTCALEILDTAGVEQFTAMRELYIKNGEGFVLVYSVTSEGSLRELEELRNQILRLKDSKKVPVVLVANKSDLVSERKVPLEEGVKLAKAWGKCPFYETSAKFGVNVEDVFLDLVRQISQRSSFTLPGNTISEGSRSASDNSSNSRNSGGAKMKSSVTTSKTNGSHKFLRAQQSHLKLAGHESNNSKEANPAKKSCTVS